MTKVTRIDRGHGVLAQPIREADGAVHIIVDLRRRQPVQEAAPRPALVYDIPGEQLLPVRVVHRDTPCRVTWEVHDFQLLPSPEVYRVPFSYGQTLGRGHLVPAGREPLVGQLVKVQRFDVVQGFRLATTTKSLDIGRVDVDLLKVVRTARVVEVYMGEYNNDIAAALPRGVD